MPFWLIQPWSRRIWGLNMLEVKSLSLRYGRHLALNEVSFQIGLGETVVILGANGAGKTSLLKALAGLVSAELGSGISLSGTEMLGLKAHKIPDMGVALVPEGRGLFGDMTVAENLVLGANVPRARSGIAQRQELVFDLFPKLADRQQQVVRTMSGGEQQMVAIARALMSNPDYLLLDEPSLGLAPIVVSELFTALEAIKGTGMAILLVEQNVSASLKLADRGYLMEAGRIVGSDTSEALKADPMVQKVFLGG